MWFCLYSMHGDLKDFDIYLGSFYGKQLETESGVNMMEAFLSTIRYYKFSSSSNCVFLKNKGRFAHIFRANFKEFPIVNISKGSADSDIGCCGGDSKVMS